MSSSLLTPKLLGQIAFMLAQNAGNAPQDFSSGEYFDHETGTSGVHVRIWYSNNTSIQYSFTAEDRLKTADEIRAKLIAEYPNAFRPQIDPKAEMRDRVRKAFVTAIESLDKLRASLVILEEATHD